MRPGLRTDVVVSVRADHGAATGGADEVDEPHHLRERGRGSAADPRISAPRRVPQSEIGPLVVARRVVQDGLVRIEDDGRSSQRVSDRHEVLAGSPAL